jgi:hypothetical protein
VLSGFAFFTAQNPHPLVLKAEKAEIISAYNNRETQPLFLEGL